MERAGDDHTSQAPRALVVHIERRTIEVPGLTVDLVERDEALDIVRTRAQSDHLPPLALASLNLDHIHHFGPGGRWAGTLDRDRGARVTLPSTIDWLNLIDGDPIAKQAHRLTGRAWPRLAGSDLANPILDLAEHTGLTVGFLGGSSETHALLTERLARTRPELHVAGCWAPSRDDLADPERSGRLADEVAARGVDILVVGIGKPRQELWIAEYGTRTRAHVLLAFGAVVDFLAGRVRRAPDWAAKAGLEWAWRLILEPRRLAKRYLGQGPAAYFQVRRWSAGRARPLQPEALAPLVLHNPQTTSRGFVPLNRPADVAAVIVTYNSEYDIGALLDDLRAEARDLRMHVVVVDNGSTDGTLPLLRKVDGVVIRSSHGTVGFAGGINVGVKALRDAEPVLVLNSKLRVHPGALGVMLRRMATTGAGIVVPRILDGDGQVSTSLRREPTVLRFFGDAVFGANVRGRSAALSETDWDVESYRYAHPVEWAAGAAMLIHPEVASRVGAWDERFFLSTGEADYFRRVRDAGVTIWYEPNAMVEQRQGTAGSSPQLDALMAVSRVRYARKYMSRPRAALFRALVVIQEAVLSYKAAHRLALRSVLSESSLAERVAPFEIGQEISRPLAGHR
jgi:exopolysaccharide biosynthesis WecB/TagA/CpsF family protein